MLKSISISKLDTDSSQKDTNRLQIVDMYNHKYRQNKFVSLRKQISILTNIPPIGDYSPSHKRYHTTESSSITPKLKIDLTSKTSNYTDLLKSLQIDQFFEIESPLLSNQNHLLIKSLSNSPLAKRTNILRQHDKSGPNNYNNTNNKEYRLSRSSTITNINQVEEFSKIINILPQCVSNVNLISGNQITASKISLNLQENTPSIVTVPETTIPNVVMEEKELLQITSQNEIDFNLIDCEKNDEEYLFSKEFNKAITDLDDYSEDELPNEEEDIHNNILKCLGLNSDVDIQAFGLFLRKFEITKEVKFEMSKNKIFKKPHYTKSHFFMESRCERSDL